MIKFELKGASQVGNILNISETKRQMFANLTIGIVGAPDEEKYELPQKTISFEFDLSLTGNQVTELLGAKAIKYVSDNYPDIA